MSPETHKPTEPIAHLDRMLWLPTDKAPIARLMSDLTVEVEQFRGESEIVELYDEKPGYFGVPRQWGLDKSNWLLADGKFEDRTTYPGVAWPEIRFPEGATYWKGQKQAIEAITQAFGVKFGALLEAKCGFGKTLCGLDIASRLHTSTLVVVHKIDLADQWLETAHGASHKHAFFPDILTGRVQAGKWEYRNRHLVVGTAQSLYSAHCDGKIPEDFFQQFGFTIFDEGHRYPARTFEQVLSMPTSRYKLGVSATWRRTDNMECVWHWHVGHTEHRATGDPVTGVYKQINWDTSLSDSMCSDHMGVNHGKWLDAIAANVPFNVWLVDQIKMGCTASRRVLVVSDRVEHLVNLCNRLHSSGAGLSVGMYVGSLPDPITGKMKTTSKESREAAKKCQVILATSKMVSEGTDIPELDTLILTTPKKDVEQIVGRIQRHHDDKKSLIVVDPVFSTKYNRNMSRKRLDTYIKLGFKKQE